ncbi:MAG: 30S ribosomal protein S6 [Armatimonadota bacterium]|nr:30S ribosomal protein S6 [Armatimonadota bacterium]MDR5704027.1 30S ribosomal protein S6 [Armatimonadota bacterium]
MKSYELVYILRPDLEVEQLESIIDRIKQRIVEQGGSIEAEDRWGMRRLAYPIRKFREGYYVVTRFTFNGAQISELKRFLELNENLLRSMIVVAEGPPLKGKEPSEREKYSEEKGETPALGLEEPEGDTRPAGAEKSDEEKGS